MTDTVTRAEGVSITIKTGKGYEDSWLGFTGNPATVKATLIETFGLTDQDDLTLYEVVANATQVAHGVTRAVTALKGTVIPSAPSGADEAQATAGQPVSDAPAEEVEDADPYVAMTKLINAENINVATLRQLYADNDALFTADTDEAKALKKTWQARGKALQQKA